MEVINKLEPKKIIYISCDTQSLSKNLSDLPNYEVTKLYLLDMFSYTYHVECVLVLHRKSLEKLKNI